MTEQVLSTPASGRPPAPLSTLSSRTAAAAESAYDEGGRRRAGGETLDLVDFCAAHPSGGDELRALLAVDELCNLEFGEEALVPPEPAWPAVGATFLGLQLKRLLGHGSFARAYLATEEEL